MTQRETIALLQSNSLATLVQDEIAKMILEGAVPAGSKLTESTLAQQLGVSRGPVREAFRMLEEAGLVRTEKNRGVFVRTIPLQEALEIFELRAVLEQFVGSKVALLAKAADVRALKAMVRDMEQAAKQGDASEFHRSNLAFHDRLFELAGNAKLTAMYQRLVNELRLCRRQNLTPESMKAYAAEHKEIVRCIAAGDAAAASAAMHAHVQGSKDRTVAYYAQHPPAQPAASSGAVGLA